MDSLQRPSVSRSFSQRFSALWQRCVRTIAANYEPYVWQTYDRQGHAIAWHVYDPSNGARQCFSSELEVRLWLEQRYR